MAQPAIEVTQLGKRYAIGQRTVPDETLRGQITTWGKQLGRRSADKQSPPQIWALQDISFTLPQGEALALIGHNGAGKTTLLKILARITYPTTGDAKVYGRVGTLLEVGMGFHPELTGRENIFLGGSILGMRRREIMQQFDAIVDFAEVETFIDTPVKFYSAGMWLRLAFAVAAHLQSDILFLDEILAVGDANFQRKCLGKMSELVYAGRTIVFVSHDLRAVQQLCTTGLVLENGQLHQMGDINEVLDFYLSSLMPSIASTIEISNHKGFERSEIGQAKRLIITDAQHQPTTVIRQGAPWHIRLEFELYQAAQDVVAVIGLHTANGIAITTLRSASHNLQAGRYHVDFTVNLPLNAHDLQFAVAINMRGRLVYRHDPIGHIIIREDTPMLAEFNKVDILYDTQHPPIEKD